MQRGSWRPVEINNQKQTNNNKKNPQKLNLAACQNVGIGGLCKPPIPTLLQQLGRQQYYPIIMMMKNATQFKLRI